MSSVDPLTSVTLASTVIILISGAFTILLGTNRLYNAATNSIPELYRQTAETAVLKAVLEESIDIFSRHGPLPESVMRAKRRCSECYDELMASLAYVRLSGNWSRWKVLSNGIRAYVNENERRAAYLAFRDSVLLLRDLATEYVHVLISVSCQRLTVM